MTRNSSSPGLIIGFLIFVWLFYLLFISDNGDICCSVCLPIVLIFVLFGMFSDKVKKPKIWATKQKWPDIWSFASVVMLIVLWIVFGLYAYSIFGGNFDGSTLSQDELNSRLYFLCLPIALIATVIILANELSHAKKYRGHEVTQVITLDHDMSRWEQKYFMESGLRRVETIDITPNKIDSQPESKTDQLMFCPNCGSKVVIDIENSKQYCENCKKYVQ